MGASHRASMKSLRVWSVKLRSICINLCPIVHWRSLAFSSVWTCCFCSSHSGFSPACTCVYVDFSLTPIFFTNSTHPSIQPDASSYCCVIWVEWRGISLWSYWAVSRGYHHAEKGRQQKINLLTRIITRNDRDAFIGFSNAWTGDIIVSYFELNFSLGASVVKTVCNDATSFSTSQIASISSIKEISST